MSVTCLTFPHTPSRVAGCSSYRRALTLISANVAMCKTVSYKTAAGIGPWHRLRNDNTLQSQICWWEKHICHRQEVWQLSRLPVKVREQQGIALPRPPPPHPFSPFFFFFYNSGVSWHQFTWSTDSYQHVWDSVNIWIDPNIELRWETNWSDIWSEVKDTVTVPYVIYTLSLSSTVKSS